MPFHAAMRLSVAGRNPEADGSECVVFGEWLGPQAEFSAVDAAADAQGWDLRAMRPGAALDEARARVGWREREHGRRFHGRAVVLSHRWSGIVEINDIGRRYFVDLFSRETRLLLLDAVNEILVDVSALARVEGGALRLEPLGARELARHVTGTLPWFRFLERDADFTPGLWRGAVEACRRKPGDALRRRLVDALLPALVSKAPAPENGLRDEMALLAAAVEGLALRAGEGA